MNINKKNLHLPNYYSSNDLINQYENTINELRKEIEFKYNNIINNEKGKESVIDILIKWRKRKILKNNFWKGNKKMKNIRWKELNNNNLK